MAVFMFKKYEYTHSDPEKDRREVHKKLDFGNFKPDGFLDFSHGNGPGDYLDHFIFIQCPEISYAEAQAYNHRRPWKDDFDYEIVGNRPAQGEYDVRVFEKNIGASNQNAITGAKLIKVKHYLDGWGCSNYSYTATDASFTFSLWNAVRSFRFWKAPLIATRIDFTLNSYTSASGLGDITATVIESGWPPMPRTGKAGFDIVPTSVSGFTEIDIPELRITKQVSKRIVDNGGTIVSQSYPNFNFTITRATVLSKFKQDVKLRAQKYYMRHRFCISQADYDAVVAAGGIVTITKAQFLSKIIDKMAI